MNKEICCSIDMFALEQDIYDDKGNKLGSCYLEDLPIKCLNFSKITDTPIIHLFGPSEYIEPIAHEILNNKLYNIQNVEVRIN